MKYATYDEYRASNIGWIRDFPAHWELKRLKYVANRAEVKVEADEDNPLPYIGLEQVEPWTGRLVDLDADLVPTGVSNRFEAGDTLFGKLRPYLAKACNVDFDGLCSSELLVLRGKSYDRKFLLYQLLSHGFVNLVDSTTYGSKMPRASWDFIGVCELPLPPLDEQNAIACFLDAKTAQIDALVAQKRQLIAKLKEKRSTLIARTVTRGLPPEAAKAAGLEPNPEMKDSVVDWLGGIPTHWTTPPLYARYSVELGKMLSEAKITGEHLIPYLRNVDVQWNVINYQDLPEMDIPPAEYPRYTIRTGDLLVCEGGEVGRAAIIGKFDGMIGYQKALHRLRALRDDEDQRFMCFILEWAAQTGVFNAGGMSTIAHLTGEQLRKYRFPKPPKNEQQVIVQYLQREIDKIGQLQREVETAIARLTEYRQALITSAVTGQIDVRAPA